MGKKAARGKMERIVRKASAAEKKLHAEIQAKIKREFPPSRQPKRTVSPNTIAGEIERARTDAGLTWYTVAKRAGIPNSSTVRNIERGDDVQLSTLQRVARVLGLEVELVERT